MVNGAVRALRRLGGFGFVGVRLKCVGKEYQDRFDGWLVSHSP